MSITTTAAQAGIMQYKAASKFPLTTSGVAENVWAATLVVAGDEVFISFFIDQLLFCDFGLELQFMQFDLLARQANNVSY